jgi:hypothetical protein
MLKKSKKWKQTEIASRMIWYSPGVANVFKKEVKPSDGLQIGQ